MYHLSMEVVPSREFLLKDSIRQKLIVMLKLQPNKELVSNISPPTAIAFVIDTSGSMYEVVTGSISKIDIIIESLLTLIRSSKLTASDYVSIVQFDDVASTIIGLTSSTQVSQLENAISQLGNFSGGTRIGLGMRHALDVFSSQHMSSRRVVIFTDGKTFDEDLCRELTKEFAVRNIPITSFGIGDYDEDLLINLSDSTGGRLFHINFQRDIYPNWVTDMSANILEEASRVKQDAITNLALTVKTVNRVKLDRIFRAYPEQAEFPLAQGTYIIGNARFGDDTVFILEFTIGEFLEDNACVAQIDLSYDVPSQNQHIKHPTHNLFMRFVAEQKQNITSQVNQDVIGYFNQGNIARIICRATAIADRDPNLAKELLETAHRLTLSIRNRELIYSLYFAQEELRRTRRISADTCKTIKMMAKGKTVKIFGNISNSI